MRYTEPKALRSVQTISLFDPILILFFSNSTDFPWNGRTASELLSLKHRLEVYIHRGAPDNALASTSRPRYTTVIDEFGGSSTALDSIGTFQAETHRTRPQA
jgi:hypothetical protein